MHKDDPYHTTQGYSYRSIEGKELHLLHPGFTRLPQPPQKLWMAGNMPHQQPGAGPDFRYICVVGTRRPSPYGEQACEYIVHGLAGMPVAIVSGLAIGIDGCAHQAALNVGLPTVAFPGSGLHPEALYPSRHLTMAERIVENGGALISEYEPTLHAAPWHFPERNRLMAGIADIIIVIEATKVSGTNITARLGLDYNKTVCAIPGSIFSDRSEGVHALIKEGAYPVTCADDVLALLEFS
jgi:DNA processing protein